MVTEFNNFIINNFLASDNVEHIFSSPRHPQTNGVVEVVLKEVRNYVLKNLNIIEYNIAFKNLILESVSVYNNNVHTVTGFKLVFLIRNTYEEIYNKVINNIKKKYKTVLDEEKDNYILNICDHLITLGGPFKMGKNIKCRKTKFKTSKIPLTVLNNFYCGVIKVKVMLMFILLKKGKLII